MSHHDHHAVDYEDPKAGPTWTIGLASIAILAVSVLVVTTLTYRELDGEEQTKVLDQRVNSGPEVLEALKAEQQARLAAAAHRELRVENPEGEESLVIPIDQAMDLLLEEARGR